MTADIIRRFPLEQHDPTTQFISAYSMSDEPMVIFRTPIEELTPGRYDAGQLPIGQFRRMPVTRLIVDGAPDSEIEVAALVAGTEDDDVSSFVTLTVTASKELVGIGLPGGDYLELDLPTLAALRRVIAADVVTMAFAAAPLDNERLARAVVDWYQLSGLGNEQNELGFAGWAALSPEERAAIITADQERGAE